MKTKKNTLIWQFYREEMPQRHFLIGTMHVRDARAFEFEMPFKHAILATDIFATEIDLDEMETIPIESVLMFRDGQILSDVLPQKLYQKVDKVLKKQSGISIQQFNYFQPIMVSNFLTESLLSNDHWQALDKTLWDFAKNSGKILRGVETTAEQIEVLKKMTLHDQIQNLKAAIENFSKHRKVIQHMANLYEKADLASLYKVAKNSAKGSRQMLIYKRNEIMVERIIELTHQNSVCTAVGAGHLAGGKGILRLLKKNGYKIFPVEKWHYSSPVYPSNL